jgi:hypothetical protein
VAGFAHALVKGVDPALATEMVLGHMLAELVGRQAIVLVLDAYFPGRKEKHTHHCTLAPAHRAIAVQPLANLGAGEAKLDGAAMATAFVGFHRHLLSDNPKNSVGLVKTRSWFDRLTTNGF